MALGHVSFIPGPGDYFSITIVDEPLLVVRGKDGVVRAFYNTCSHRGSIVVNQRRGSSLTFRCPYHSWLYGADGQLRAIPAEEQFPCVDKAKNGLAPITLDIWNGFIFLNFDLEPKQTLRAFLGGLGELHETLPFDRYKFHTRTVSDFQSNWKSGMHSFSEGYHITTVHAQTLTPQIVTRGNPLFQFYDIRIFGPHSTLTSERNFDWRPETPVVKFATAQMPPAVMPRTGDTQERDFATHPSINRIGIPNFGVETITIFPNICLQPLGGGYLWLTFWPLAPDRTRVEVRLHAERAPASLREEFATASSASAARDVLTEDFALAALQQRGFAMQAKTHQNFGRNEALLRYFAKAVDHYLYGGEDLPEMLAAADATTG
jgi:phenylpropionate dioxygenase-like ring-hydroxylating dioxygenase large terminal subunit